MVDLKPIPEHFRSQEKFDVYIAEIRKELVPLLTSNVYIRRKNLKHRQNIHATLTNEQKEYNSFKDNPSLYIKTVNGCGNAFIYLLESIRSHKCLFILDQNDKLFVLKTIGELGVFDVYGKKFGRLSNDIYI